MTIDDEWGIGFDKMRHQLEDGGVKKFNKPFDNLMVAPGWSRIP